MIARGTEGASRYLASVSVGYAVREGIASNVCAHEFGRAVLTALWDAGFDVGYFSVGAFTFDDTHGRLHVSVDVTRAVADEPDRALPPDYPVWDDVYGVIAGLHEVADRPWLVVDISLSGD